MDVKREESLKGAGFACNFGATSSPPVGTSALAVWKHTQLEVNQFWVQAVTFLPASTNTRRSGLCKAKCSSLGHRKAAPIASDFALRRETDAGCQYSAERESSKKTQACGGRGLRTDRLC